MLQNYVAKVKTKQELLKNIFRFEFSLLKPSIIEFKAGQYLLLDVKQGFRHYSISSSPRQNHILETVVDTAPMGIGSQYLLSLNVGDKVNFKAPIGLFILPATTKTKIFLATGTGIVPLISMLTSLAETKFKKNYQLFWGLRTKTDLYFTDRLASLQKQNPNFDYTYCLSKEEVKDEQCFSGHIQDALLILNSKFSIPTNSAGKLNYEFYLCGRPQTVDQLKQFLIDNIKVSETQIFHEKFT